MSTKQARVPTLIVCVIAAWAAGAAPKFNASVDPGAPIPHFVLNEAFRDKPFYVESGDTLEVRLTETSDLVQWRRFDTSDIKAIAPVKGALEEHDGEMQRVFRFSTGLVGRIELLFRLVNRKNNEVRSDPVNFVIVVQ